MYDCPIVLKLYGSRIPFQKRALKDRMTADRLPLSEVNRRDRERQKEEKERERLLKGAEKRARAMTKGMGQGQQWNLQGDMFANLHTPDGMGAPASYQDLLHQSSTFNPRQMGQAVENYGIKESDLAKMPMVDTPRGMETQLLSYQRQGLAWMLEKESPSIHALGSNETVQLWRREGNRYQNIATNYSMSQQPPLASGGILADDMGLGKTIQIISLIMANSTPKTTDSTKTTLIISPVGVMSNWKNQIEAHISSEHALRVLVYHGTGKKEAANLDQYDVVITSYGALAVEFDPNDKIGKIPSRGLFSMHWRRVVLDEGHTIRNPRSKGALAACKLRADSRWTLTGTPIINSLRDLYSQIRFLRLSGGLEDLAMFNAVLIRPLSYGDPTGTYILQKMMAAICLRRRKDMSFVNLRLPPLQSHVLRVKFHPHEQEKYDMFQ
jgi:SWI/SNF-related matrix-associated actin-dependent regulator of chromatin subfamily A3